MKIEIRKSDGRWTVNGKSLSEMNQEEQLFMDEFFKTMKLNNAESV